MSDQQGGSRYGSGSVPTHARSERYSDAAPSAYERGDGTALAIPLPTPYRGETVAAPPLAAGNPWVGAIVDGRYRVEALLGEGGMGVVFRCRHQIIDKVVAMKVLRADLACDEEATKRFLNEARSASAIGNPHIVDISDFGRLPDGSTYFIMEYLDGKPLSSVSGRGQPVPVQRILDIAVQLAEGLAAAHRAGIVHRDLKPDNIFLVSRGSERSFVKILDFGIAKVSTAGQTSKLTRAGAIFGTPHYMSPEQAAGAPVDHRVDVYALGVILYELASGRLPFDSDHFAGILTQHMYKAPVPLRALVPAPPDVPVGFDAVVLKCLSKRPEHRYGSMEELLADLSRVRAGLVPVAVSEFAQHSQGFDLLPESVKSDLLAPVPAPPTRLPAAWPIYAGLAGVALLVVGAAIALSSRNGAPSTPPTTSHSTSMLPPAPPAPSPSPAPSQSVVDAPTAEPVRHTVMVRVEPPDAHVFEGARDLGTGAITIAAQVDRPRTLEVRRDGYLPQSVTVDGSLPSVLIKLEPMGHRARGATPRSVGAGVAEGPEPSGPNTVAAQGAEPVQGTEPTEATQASEAIPTLSAAPPLGALPAPSGAPHVGSPTVDKPDSVLVEPWPSR